MTIYVIKFTNGDIVVAEVQPDVSTAQIAVRKPMLVYEKFDRSNNYEVVVNMEKFLKFGTSEMRVPWSAIQVIAEPTQAILAMYLEKIE